MTRTEKIKALAAIRDGHGTIAPLMDTVCEFWETSDKQPDIFINVATGQRLTKADFNKRQEARPYLIIFLYHSCK
jgi:hypothetical protein